MELWQYIGAAIGQVFLAGAIYGAIRADLRNLREQVTRAHQRIDELMIAGSKA